MCIDSVSLYYIFNSFIVFVSLYLVFIVFFFCIFFFKQKTAYEMRISDWSSDVCSSDLDNQPAKFLVGQEVPITTGEALSDNFDEAFRTVQREEVGIKLDVTPQVNGAGEVKLFLRQEVSSVAGPVSSRNSDLIINKRSFETVLTVDDGEILAIGGLLNDDERKTIERIPLLSDIPLIGELFKSRSRTRSKTNLMVFIRPTILKSREDNAALTARRYGYLRDFQLQRNPDQEPAIDALLPAYLGATPPSPPTPPPIPPRPAN